MDVPPEAVDTADKLDDDAPSPIFFHFETQSRLPVPPIAGVENPSEAGAQPEGPARKDAALDPRSRPN